MDTQRVIEKARTERISGGELMREGKLDQALLHLDRSIVEYESLMDPTGEQRDELATVLYDVAETKRSLGKGQETALTLRKAWLISGTALASRGRGIALGILTTETSTNFPGPTRQSLRTTAFYILSALDLNHPTNGYAFEKDVLSTPTERPRRKREIGAWAIIQLTLLAIYLLFRIASC
jgi:hypothetical protein